MRKPKLHWQILCALLAALGVGILTSQEGWTVAGMALPHYPSVAGIAWTDIFGFLGQMLFNLLMMLTVALIASSIIVGVTGIGQS